MAEETETRAHSAPLVEQFIEPVEFDQLHKFARPLDLLVFQGEWLSCGHPLEFFWLWFYETISLQRQFSTTGADLVPLINYCLAKRCVSVDMHGVDVSQRL